MNTTPATIAHYVNGHVVAGGSARQQAVFNPATGVATGLVALVGGILLGLYSLRVEAATPGDSEDDLELGLFGKDETGPMPAAQALTEKIPTRRPESPPSLP